MTNEYTTFIDSFNACNVSSSIIVFMSILFGFTSTSFSFVIFSDVAKKLYAKSSEYNSSNEFYDVVRVYEKSFISRAYAHSFDCSIPRNEPYGKCGIYQI